MRKYYLLQSLLLLFLCSEAQKNMEVVNVEKQFALFASEQNTKAAFLQFMDSNAVVFDKGQVLNAKKVWTANAVPSGKLIWKPAFSATSLHGDLAFTTGPWEFKQSTNDTAVAVGEFATIWHKTESGDWKFLVDLGVGFPKPAFQFSTITLAKAGTKSTADAVVLNNLERQVNAAFKQQGAAALLPLITNDAWFVIRNHYPLQGRNNIVKQAVAVIPAAAELDMITGGVSNAGDLAYVYGQVRYADKNENYLRVWLHVRKGWRIVLFVMQ